MKILQPFYLLYILTVFVTSMIIILPLTLLLSLFGTQKLIFYIIKYWSKYWLFMIGMPVDTGNKPWLPNDKYVYVANHISYLDSMVIFSAIDSYFRVLGNKEFSRKFLIGLIYRQIVVMVDRSNSVSRANSFKELLQYVKDGNSIFIFPEGKFNTTKDILVKFYDGAFKIAVDTQTDVVPMILPDTINRWHYSAWWKITPGKNRAILLSPVSPVGLTVEELKQKVYSIIETELKRTI